MSNRNNNKLWINWEEVIKLAAGKRVIFFGRGEWLEKSMPYLGRKADYVVDNNEYEQGQIENNLNIKNPNILSKENLEDILVIITTTGFQEVTAQLVEFGLIPGQHFIVSPSLKNFHSIQRINEQDCTLLFSCADRPQNDPLKGGGFYSYELQTRRLKKIFSGVCHGFVYGNDLIWLVDDLVGVRVLNKDFTEITNFGLPAKSRPHGIAFNKESEKIFINFAGRDSIGVYDAKTYEKINEVFISNKWEKVSIPQHHLNDLYAHGNSLYVSMFSLSGNWKRGVYDGGILEVDIETLQIKGPVITDLWMPHSPVVLNGNLCYCDSMRGSVHNTTWKSITRFNGFVRGIAHDGEFYYVGQSMHRYVDRLEHVTNNISLDTGIYIVDEHNKTTKFFSIHQLTDIKAIALKPFSDS
jgi:Domain of unknown function (DUF4915)